MAGSFVVSLHNIEEAGRREMALAISYGVYYSTTDSFFRQ